MLHATLPAASAGGSLLAYFTYFTRAFSIFFYFNDPKKELLMSKNGGKGKLVMVKICLFWDLKVQILKKGIKYK